MFTRALLRYCVVPAVSLTSMAVLNAQSLPQMRMTPAEVVAIASAPEKNQIGSSGLEGVHTKVLFGSPEKAGYYSILLYVPAHTTIPAHSHRDDRVAVVVFHREACIRNPAAWATITSRKRMPLL